MLNIAELSAKRHKIDSPEGLTLVRSENRPIGDPHTEFPALIAVSSLEPSSHLHLAFSPGPEHYPLSDKHLPRRAELALDTKLVGKDKENRLKISLNDEVLTRANVKSAFHEELPRGSSFSWDRIELGQHVQPTASSDQERGLDYDNETKRLILFAAQNLTFGFYGAFFRWQPGKMRFELEPGAQRLSFAGYLESFAHTGSLIRRLGQACEDIGQHTQSLDCRVVVALASAIEKEVSEIQTQSYKTSGLDNSDQLVGFALFQNPIATDVQTLADVVGCSGMRGRLSRIPSAIELLERAYDRACMLDSEVLWRLVVSCMTPWLDQLNYAVGLIEPTASRSLSSSLKDAFFPELFIDFAGDTKSAILVHDEIPNFMPSKFAESALECYKILTYLSKKGPEALRRASSPPLMPYALAQHTVEPSPHILQPANGLTAVHDMAHRPPDFARPRVPPALKKPVSVQLEVRKTFNPILVQCARLNCSFKVEFSDELNDFKNVVTGLYYLRDGWLWSQFSELTSSLFKNWDVRRKHSELLIAMNELIGSRYGASVRSSRAEHNELSIVYTPPPIMAEVFGVGLLHDYQAVFTRIIRLNYGGQTRELGILGAEIELISSRLESTLFSATSGLREVRAAFLEVPKVGTN